MKKLAPKTLLVVGSILILGAYTTYFKIVDENSPYENVINRVTKAGIAFYVLVGGLIVLNILVEHQDDQEKTQNRLHIESEIQSNKKAIEVAGMKYDFVTKTIVEPRQKNVQAAIYAEGEGHTIKGFNIIEFSPIMNIGEKANDPLLNDKEMGHF